MLNGYLCANPTCHNWVLRDWEIDPQDDAPFLCSAACISSFSTLPTIDNLYSTL